MNFPARLPPKIGRWFSDWEPSKRPIHLPLPKLEYDSQFEVWEWKLRNLLRHNSLLGFINHRGPVAPLAPRNLEQQEESAAAAHCLALLGSCISEDILADLLILSPNNELPEDPCRLLTDVKKHVHDVQNPWKQSNPHVWEIFVKQGLSNPTVQHLLDDLKRSHFNNNKDSSRNLVLMGALVVKRRFPFCPTDIVRKYISKTKHAEAGVGEETWSQMTQELEVIRAT